MNRSRRLFGSLLAVLLALLPLAPPEHVHDVLEADGHHELVVHRHTQLHGLLSLHGGTTVDHTDDDATNLDEAYTSPSVPAVHPAAAVSVVLLTFPEATAARRRAAVTTPLAHGPPRAPTHLRAPPAILS